MFVPNFKILSTVVPEKSLTEKKVTHTRKKQKLYTPYILRIPGINIFNSAPVKDLLIGQGQLTPRFMVGSSQISNSFEII